MTNIILDLAAGEIDVEIEGTSQRPQIIEEVYIPANVFQTVRNGTRHQSMERYMVSADIQIILDPTQFSWPMIITSGLILGVLSIVFVASRAARKEQNE